MALPTRPISDFRDELIARSQNITQVDKIIGINADNLPQGWNNRISDIIPDQYGSTAPLTRYLGDLQKRLSQLAAEHPEHAEALKLETIVDFRKFDRRMLETQLSPHALRSVEIMLESCNGVLYEGWHNKKAATDTLVKTGMTLEDIQQLSAHTNAINAFVSNIHADMAGHEKLEQDLPVELNNLILHPEILKQFKDAGLQVECHFTFTKKPDQPIVK